MKEFLAGRAWRGRDHDRSGCLSGR